MLRIQGWRSHGPSWGRKATNEDGASHQPHPSLLSIWTSARKRLLRGREDHLEASEHCPATQRRWPKQNTCPGCRGHKAHSSLQKHLVSPGSVPCLCLPGPDELRIAGVLGFPPHPGQGGQESCTSRLWSPRDLGQRLPCPS